MRGLGSASYRRVYDLRSRRGEGEEGLVRAGAERQSEGGKLPESRGRNWLKVAMGGKRG